MLEHTVPRICAEIRAVQLGAIELPERYIDRTTASKLDSYTTAGST